jgi:hypothetical protein
MAPVRVVVEHPEEGSQRSVVDKKSGPGLTRVPIALMRGMFVDVVFHLRPRSELIAVPILALKPGGQVWKFVRDDDVLDRLLPGEKSNEEKKDNRDKDNHDKGNGIKEEKGSQGEKESNAAQRSTLVNAAGGFDVGAWQAGRIEILDGVRSVSSVGKYWICEVPEGRLLAGDSLIVTPLSGVGSGESIGVRVPAAPKGESVTPN